MQTEVTKNIVQTVAEKEAEANGDHWDTISNADRVMYITQVQRIMGSGLDCIGHRATDLGGKDIAAMFASMAQQFRKSHDLVEVLGASNGNI